MRLRLRFGMHGNSMNLPVLALEVHLIARPGLQCNFHGLLQAGATLLLWNPVSHELSWSIPPADADGEAPSTDNVKRSHLLGESNWVMKWQDVDCEPYVEPGGPTQDGGGKDAGSGGEAVIGKVMLCKPDRVIPERLGIDHLIQLSADDVRFPSTRGPLKKVVHAEFHRWILNLPELPGWQPSQSGAS